MSKGRAKIACTIDPELLGKVERLRAFTGESRSAVIGRALAKLIDGRAGAARIARYKQAYREQPESAADLRVARKQARRVLATLAWNEE